MLVFALWWIKAVTMEGHVCNQSQLFDDDVFQSALRGKHTKKNITYLNLANLLNIYYLTRAPVKNSSSPSRFHKKNMSGLPQCTCTFGLGPYFSSPVEFYGSWHPLGCTLSHRFSALTCWSVDRQKNIFLNVTACVKNENHLRCLIAYLSNLPGTM